MEFEGIVNESCLKPRVKVYPYLLLLFLLSHGHQSILLRSYWALGTNQDWLGSIGSAWTKRLSPGVWGASSCTTGPCFWLWWNHIQESKSHFRVRKHGDHWWTSLSAFWLYLCTIPVNKWSVWGGNKLTFKTSQIGKRIQTHIILA